MNKAFFLFLPLFLLSVVAFSQDSQPDGSSFDKAIVITETTETAGIAAEYKWLNQHYPGYKMKKQALSHHDGKPYDILYFKHKRKKRTIYFDISAFFGKF